MKLITWVIAVLVISVAILTVIVAVNLYEPVFSNRFCRL